MTVLILGGTAEARELAAALVDAGQEVVSSLAGRVSAPAMPAGEVRVGGFGGVAGLARYLAGRRIATLVDATHPFAATISGSAARAAAATRCPAVRLERPSWRSHPRAGDWIWVPSVDAARAVADPLAYRPFLTTGRQSLRSFLSWADRDVVARVVDPPTGELPPRWQLIRSRGPYDYPSERRTLTRFGIDCLVTKDSGGALTAAKLDAAADLGLPVVVIARPVPPANVPPLPQVSSVPEVLDWLAGRGSSGAVGQPEAGGRGAPR